MHTANGPTAAALTTLGTVDIGKARGDVFSPCKLRTLQLDPPALFKTRLREIGKVSAETFAQSLIEGLQQADVALVAGLPDGLLAPAIARIEALERPRYVACAREEECIGVAAGAIMTGQRAAVLCQNAGFLNSIGAFATLAVRYRLPMVCIVANRGGLGDAKPYDIEKFEAFSRAAPQVTHVHPVTFAQFNPSVVVDAFAWAKAADRPMILSIERGTR